MSAGTGKLWLLGLQAAAAREQSLKAEMAAKHHQIMFSKKWFQKTFGVDVQTFYKDVFIGFDIVAFDDFLMTKDEQYRKANAGELGDDVDCSMETHLRQRYGEEAAKRIRSFI